MIEAPTPVPGRDRYRIAFTEAEGALVARIDFGELGTHAERHAAYLANRQPILQLLESLSERDAVPAQRLGTRDGPCSSTGR